METKGKLEGKRSMDFLDQEVEETMEGTLQYAASDNTLDLSDNDSDTILDLSQDNLPCLSSEDIVRNYLGQLSSGSDSDEVTLNLTQEQLTERFRIEQFYSELCAAIEREIVNDIRKRKFTKKHYNIPMINMDDDEDTEGYNRELMTNLIRCVEMHNRNASAYRRVYEELDHHSTQLEEALECIDLNWEDISDQTALEEPGEVNELLQDTLETYDSWSPRLDKVKKKCANIVPVLARATPSEGKRPAVSLCDYIGHDISLRKGERIVILDNNDENDWQIINNRGKCGTVPAPCCFIPPPDRKALSKANKLTQKLLSHWRETVGKIRRLIQVSKTDPTRTKSDLKTIRHMRRSYLRLQQHLHKYHDLVSESQDRDSPLPITAPRYRRSSSSARSSETEMSSASESGRVRSGMPGKAEKHSVRSIIGRFSRDGDSSDYTSDNSVSSYTQKRLPSSKGDYKSDDADYDDHSRRRRARRDLKTQNGGLVLPDSFAKKFNKDGIVYDGSSEIVRNDPKRKASFTSSYNIRLLKGGHELRKFSAGSIDSDIISSTTSLSGFSSALSSQTVTPTGSDSETLSESQSEYNARQSRRKISVRSKSLPRVLQSSNLSRPGEHNSDWTNGFSADSANSVDNRQAKQNGDILEKPKMAVRQSRKAQLDVRLGGTHASSDNETFKSNNKGQKKVINGTSTDAKLESRDYTIGSYALETNLSENDDSGVAGLSNLSKSDMSSRRSRHGRNSPERDPEIRQTDSDKHRNERVKNVSAVVTSTTATSTESRPAPTIRPAEKESIGLVRDRHSIPKPRNAGNGWKSDTDAKEHPVLLLAEAIFKTVAVEQKEGVVATEAHLSLSGPRSATPTRKLVRRLSSERLVSSDTEGKTKNIQENTSCNGKNEVQNIIKGISDLTTGIEDQEIHKNGGRGQAMLDEQEQVQANATNCHQTKETPLVTTDKMTQEDNTHVPKIMSPISTGLIEKRITVGKTRGPKPPLPKKPSRRMSKEEVHDAFSSVGDFNSESRPGVPDKLTAECSVDRVWAANEPITKDIPSANTTCKTKSKKETNTDPKQKQKPGAKVEQTNICIEAAIQPTYVHYQRPKSHSSDLVGTDGDDKAKGDNWVKVKAMSSFIALLHAKQDNDHPDNSVKGLRQKAEEPCTETKLMHKEDIELKSACGDCEVIFKQTVGSDTVERTLINVVGNTEVKPDSSRDRAGTGTGKTNWDKVRVLSEFLTTLEQEDTNDHQQTHNAEKEQNIVHEECSLTHVTKDKGQINIHLLDLKIEDPNRQYSAENHISASILSNGQVDSLLQTIGQNGHVSDKSQPVENIGVMADTNTGATDNIAEVTGHETLPPVVEASYEMQEQSLYLHPEIPGKNGLIKGVVLDIQMTEGDYEIHEQGIFLHEEEVVEHTDTSQQRAPSSNVVIKGNVEHTQIHDKSDLNPPTPSVGEGGAHVVEETIVPIETSAVKNGFVKSRVVDNHANDTEITSVHERVKHFNELTEHLNENSNSGEVVHSDLEELCREVKIVHKDKPTDEVEYGNAEVVLKADVRSDTVERHVINFKDIDHQTATKGNENKEKSSHWTKVKAMTKFIGLLKDHQNSDAHQNTTYEVQELCIKQTIVEKDNISLPVSANREVIVKQIHGETIVEMFEVPLEVDVRQEVAKPGGPTDDAVKKVVAALHALDEDAYGQKEHGEQAVALCTEQTTYKDPDEGQREENDSYEKAEVICESSASIQILENKASQCEEPAEEAEAVKAVATFLRSVGQEHERTSRVSLAEDDRVLETLCHEAVEAMCKADRSSEFVEQDSDSATDGIMIVIENVTPPNEVSIKWGEPIDAEEEEGEFVLEEQYSPTNLNGGFHGSTSSSDSDDSYIVSECNPDIVFLPNNGNVTNEREEVAKNVRSSSNLNDGLYDSRLSPCLDENYSHNSDSFTTFQDGYTTPHDSSQFVNSGEESFDGDYRESFLDNDNTPQGTQNDADMNPIGNRSYQPAKPGATFMRRREIKLRRPSGKDHDPEVTKEDSQIPSDSLSETTSFEPIIINFNSAFDQQSTDHHEDEQTVNVSRSGTAPYTFESKLETCHIETNSGNNVDSGRDIPVRRRISRGQKFGFENTDERVNKNRDEGQTMNIELSLRTQGTTGDRFEQCNESERLVNGQTTASLDQSNQFGEDNMSSYRLDSEEVMFTKQPQRDNEDQHLAHDNSKDPEEVSVDNVTEENHSTASEFDECWANVYQNDVSAITDEVVGDIDADVSDDQFIDRQDEKSYTHGSENILTANTSEPEQNTSQTFTYNSDKQTWDTVTCDIERDDLEVFSNIAPTEEDSFYRPRAYSSPSSMHLSNYGGARPKTKQLATDEEGGYARSVSSSPPAAAPGGDFIGMSPLQRARAMILMHEKERAESLQQIDPTFKTSAAERARQMIAEHELKKAGAGLDFRQRSKSLDRATILRRIRRDRGVESPDHGRFAVENALSSETRGRPKLRPGLDEGEVSPERGLETTETTTEMETNSPPTSNMPSFQSPLFRTKSLDHAVFLSTEGDYRFNGDREEPTTPEPEYDTERRGSFGSDAGSTEQEPTHNRGFGPGGSFLLASRTRTRSLDSSVFLNSVSTPSRPVEGYLARYGRNSSQTEITRTVTPLRSRSYSSSNLSPEYQRTIESRSYSSSNLSPTVHKAVEFCDSSIMTVDEMAHKFRIESVVDPWGASLSLAEAVQNGIIDMEGGSYVNPITKNSMSIETAVVKKLIMQRKFTLEDHRRLRDEKYARSKKDSGGSVSTSPGRVFSPPSSPSTYRRQHTYPPAPASPQVTQSAHASPVSSLRRTPYVRPPGAGNSAYGLIHINSHQSGVPCSIKSVANTLVGKSTSFEVAKRCGIIDTRSKLFLDKKYGRRITFDEAIEEGLMEIDNEADDVLTGNDVRVCRESFLIYGVMDQEQQKRVSLTEAVSQGLIDTDQGTYYDNCTHQSQPIYEAISNDYLKGKRVEGSSLNLYQGMVAPSSVLELNRDEYARTYVGSGQGRIELAHGSFDMTI